MPAEANVLQLITELRPGGAERVVEQLAMGLDGKRYRIAVCSLRRPDPALRSRLEARGIELLSLDIKTKLDLLAPRRLAAQLRSMKVSLLHSHLFHANVLGSIAIRHLPKEKRPVCVRSVHAVEEPRRPWRSWLEALTLGKGDSIVCVSESAKRSFGRRSRIEEDRLLVIPNGVDLESHAEKRAVRRRLRSELCDRLQINPSGLIVCTVGRLEARKGQDDLLHAWRELSAAQDSPRVMLLLAGQGRHEKRLLRLTRDLGIGGRVNFLGQVADVPSLLAACDLFVMPSRAESFCLALAEAMASALPIVTTDLAASRELLGPGRAALFVPPADVRGLCSGLRRILGLSENERALMGEAARERSVLFDLHAMLGRYESLYSRLLTTQ